VKRDFGYRKVAYKGLKKNLNRFHIGGWTKKEIHDIMNIQKEKESFVLFTKNPYWRETYENAP
jgi:hypothetical protein